MLVHIHGFNSNAQSHTLALLRQVVPQAHGLEYPSERCFSRNMRLLYEQLIALTQRSALWLKEGLIISGSSLGGFYASQLAAQWVTHMAHAPHTGGEGAAKHTVMSCACLLINPVVYPFKALRPFVGVQKHFYTGKQWLFTETSLRSYTHFSDTRLVPMQRLVVLGKNDALLDPTEGKNYWRQCATVHETEDGHSLTALDAVIINFLEKNAMSVSIGTR